MADKNIEEMQGEFLLKGMIEEFTKSAMNGILAGMNSQELHPVYVANYAKEVAIETLRGIGYSSEDE